jgi:RNA polymerase sigma-70 factor (ECF subfamily)
LRATRAAKRSASPEMEREAGPAAGFDPPDEAVELAQRRSHVRRALAELRPEQRAALELAYYQGLSHSEIAERLGQPLGTVKTRIRQAMSTMRRALSPWVSPP